MAAEGPARGIGISAAQKSLLSTASNRAGCSSFLGLLLRQNTTGSSCDAAHHGGNSDPPRMLTLGHIRITTGGCGMRWMLTQPRSLGGKSQPSPPLLADKAGDGAVIVPLSAGLQNDICNPCEAMWGTLAVPRMSQPGAGRSVPWHSHNLIYLTSPAVYISSQISSSLSKKTVLRL